MCACVISCFWLCDPVDCSPPGSSVHGILQARILERFAISSSRGSSWRRDRTPISCDPCNCCIGQWILYHFSHLGSKDFCWNTVRSSLNAWWELPLLLVSLCLSAAQSLPLWPCAVLEEGAVFFHEEQVYLGRGCTLPAALVIMHPLANGLIYILAVGRVGVVTLAIGIWPVWARKIFSPKVSKNNIRELFFCWWCGSLDSCNWDSKSRKGGVDGLRPLVSSCSPALGVHQNQVNFRKVFAQRGICRCCSRGPEPSPGQGGDALAAAVSFQNLSAFISVLFCI